MGDLLCRDEIVVVILVSHQLPPWHAFADCWQPELSRDSPPTCVHAAMLDRQPCSPVTRPRGSHPPKTHALSQFLWRVHTPERAPDKEVVSDLQPTGKEEGQTERRNA